MCTLPADESNVLARCARDVVLAVLLGMIVRPEGQIGYAPIVAEVLADEGVAGVKRTSTRMNSSPAVAVPSGLLVPLSCCTGDHAAIPIAG